MCVLLNLHVCALTTGFSVIQPSNVTHLDLLFLRVEHVGVDAQRSQHAHHQLLLPQPRAQLTGRGGKVTQPVDARLQFRLPLGRRLIGCLPACVWGNFQRKNV